MGASTLGLRGEEEPAFTSDCSPPETVVRLTAGVA